MKVYNQGTRLFTYFELQFKPNQFTHVPDNHVEGVSKMIKSYPTELVTAEDAQSAHRNASGTISELTAENTKLKAQLAKAQSLLIALPEPSSEIDALKAIVAELENALEFAKSNPKRAPKAAVT